MVRGSLKQRSDSPVEPGCRFKVERDGDMGWFLATIMERRPLKKVRKSKGANVDLGELNGTDFEYYVNYDGMDSRCDEWVVLDRIDTRIPYPKLSSNPVEKSKKRRTVDELRVNENLLDVAPTKRGSGALISTSNNKDDEASVVRARGIQECVIGQYRCKTWYDSNYPVDKFKSEECIFLCEFCLEYKQNISTLQMHRHQCVQREQRCPPGALIYHDPSCKLAMWEIDGKAESYYCTNLCSMSKLFLKDKSMYNKTDNFYFYVLCEYDDKGAHIVGYFSKEKASPQHYNVACIMVLPPYQCKGYGKFLISASYELSKVDGNSEASPEKPLSDLGEKTYMKYWCTRILREMTKMETRQGENDEAPRGHGATIDEIWRATNICRADIETALEYMADKVLPAGEDGRPLRYNEMGAKSKVAICAYTVKPFVYNAFMRKMADAEKESADGDKKGRGECNPAYLHYEPKDLWVSLTDDLEQG